MAERVECLGCGKPFTVDIFDMSKDGLCPKCSKAAIEKSKHEDEQTLVAEEKQALQENELAGAKIILSTGEPGRPYQVIDVVFAIDTADQSAFTRRAGADPGAAFNKVKMQLRHQCAARGGDAVMQCRFFHRLAEGSNFPAGKQTMEIFAYGTAVKFV
jgi:DNA-directed RNA polymerase subunit RPC12/RpoP